ncbi:uncharacterized protein zgc:174888 [Neoarius graeffei]|uniref:uncharacterized protein zgc:174888 n=1 Tax=Neoarius graeffei TaxID=443677 RepID=UPI00298C9F25|nr:uncharacterized protein zgc:174888 [Neoarius graeffei]
MLPTVLLLLLVLSVRGRACNELEKETVRNLQSSIEHEEQKGFREVFPKNYYVQHHFNESTQCDDSCCVLSAVVFLWDSWKQLLQHVEQIHMKHSLIAEIIVRLHTIWKKSFQETPNPSVFPSFQSSPRTLLTSTSDVLSKWLDLNCPVDRFCVFPSPAPLFTDKKGEEKQEHSVTDRAPVKEFEYGKEGEREKRWLTVTPKNGDMGLSAFPTFSLCILCCLWMLLDLTLKELG